MESFKFRLVRHYYALLTALEISSELITTVKTAALFVHWCEQKLYCCLQLSSLFLWRTLVLFNCCRCQSCSWNAHLILFIICLPTVFLQLSAHDLGTAGREWQADIGYNNTNNIPLSRFQIITIVSGHFICNIQVCRFLVNKMN